MLKYFFRLTLLTGLLVLVLGFATADAVAGNRMAAYFDGWSTWTGALDGATAELPEQGLRWDLRHPRYDGSPETPAWAHVTVPDWVRPFKGKNGMPHWARSYKRAGSTCGGAVAGIDLYHANYFIVYRPETAAYIYGEYTPLDAAYIPGTLPRYELVAAKYTHPDMTETEKMLALLKNALPAEIPHPGTPPYGERVRGDRGLLDDDLLASGSAWCNEQGRVLIRLCQVLGMQGRLVHLFGQNHSSAEIHVDGQWVLVDASWYFVSRDEDGNMLSAAESHDRGPGQRGWALSRQRRMLEIGEMTAEQANMEQEEAWEPRRQRWMAQGSDEATETLATNDQTYFGVMNTPVPPVAKASDMP